MGAVAFVKHDDWKNIPLFALDNIAMRTAVSAIFVISITILAVYICHLIVLIHEKFGFFFIKEKSGI